MVDSLWILSACSLAVDLAFLLSGFSRIELQWSLSFTVDLALRLVSFSVVYILVTTTLPHNKILDIVLHFVILESI